MQSLDLMSIASLLPTDSYNSFEGEEKQEEIDGFDRICKNAFYEMQTHNNLDLDKTVTETIIKRDRKGDIKETIEKQHTIKGSELHGRWNDFVKAHPEVVKAIQLCRLTGVRERIRDFFAEWVLTESWDRFRLLRKEEHRQWVYDNVNITVTNVILIEKHDQSRSGKKTFVDDTIRILMINLITNRESLGKQAAGVNRGFKVHGLGKEDIKELPVEEKERVISSKAEVVEVVAREIREEVSGIRKNLPTTEELPIALIGGGDE